MPYRPNAVTNPYFAYQYHIDIGYNYLKALVNNGANVNDFNYVDVMQGTSFDYDKVVGFLRNGKRIDVIEVVSTPSRGGSRYRFTPCALFKFERCALDAREYDMIRAIDEIIAARGLRKPVDLSL